MESQPLVVVSSDVLLSDGVFAWKPSVTVSVENSVSASVGTSVEGSVSSSVGVSED